MVFDTLCMCMFSSGFRFYLYLYVLELRNRFETLQEKTEKSTPNDEYENFVNAHIDAAAK